MRRGSPLRRKTPLRPAAGERSQRGTGPSQDVVEAVCERAVWSCERCGIGVGPRRGTDHHIHHRRPRASGGSRRPDTNLPCNLLLLCPPCHDEVESRRAESIQHGWLLSQLDDPESSSVLIRFERFVYLTRSGGYSINPPGGPDV